MFRYIIFFLTCFSQMNCESDRRVITTLKYSKFRVKPTIVNGKPAIKGQIPYLVSIKQPVHSFSPGRITWRNLCGGSIIDELRVLTAAHCFEGKGFYYAKHSEKLRVVAGTLRNEMTHSGETDTNIINQWRKIKTVILHQNFYFPDHDIAIVFVDEAWKFLRNVDFVTPASKEKDYFGLCVSAGFGQPGHGPRNVVSQILLIAPINIIPQMLCSRLWEMNMRSFICSDSSFTDVAKGDSGGPLACKETSDPKEKPGKDLLVGIVSGKNFDKTTIYTRVSAYRGWIDNNDGNKLGIQLNFISIITTVMSIYILFSYTKK
ncbi:serine protease 55-like [Leptidea sinapis]|uniref:serine protease 55-like n=1 Tax=Leptidea sinapis TaxID=189913 RepID=UPI0021C3A2FA|nr:serine protease 55-like [Leptidea sinapis]